MSEIDDIPPDEMIELTESMKRAFLALDCDPECHCCGKPIEIGQKFKLAYIERPKGGWTDPDSTDEMLCYHCTPEKLLAQEKEQREERERRSRGGYTRAHR